jgi:hypothetical protein
MVQFLSQYADISMGYASRRTIEPTQHGSHLLLQPGDVDRNMLTYNLESLIRFNPTSSMRGSLLRPEDIVFMARGSLNFAILLHDIPDGLVVAAAAFFIVRVRSKELLPAYLSWYLNTDSVKNYFRRYRGKGVHMPVVRRTVLENVEIPTPPLEIQRKIVELNSLEREEQKLVTTLSKKRKILMEKVCLQAAQGK